MTPDLVIAGLAAVVFVLFVVAVRLVSNRNALAVRLAATTANLQKYVPLDAIDVEIARRRMTLQTETARATQEMTELRRQVEAAVRHMREEAESETVGLSARLQLARDDLARAEARLAQYELTLDLEEMAFYQPKFDFADAPQYADALDLVREAQKELVRQKLLLEEIGPAAAPGMKNLGRLAVHAFNGDAAAIVDAVSYENFEASKEKLRREFDKLNRLLEAAGVRISSKYLELKVKEMALAYDYRHAEEQAKRQQASLKDTMRKQEEARQEAERLRERAPEGAPRDRVVFGTPDLTPRRREQPDVPHPNGDARSSKHE